MNDFLLLPQRVDGKDENVLINMSHVERIVQNSYDENQCILLYHDGGLTHISLSLSEIHNYMIFQLDTDE